MLATGSRAGEFGFEGDPRGAAEFAHADDQRLVEQAAPSRSSSRAEKL